VLVWTNPAAAAAVAAGTGVHAHAAAQVLRQLEPLQQQLAGLAAGSLEGDWEGALELVGHLRDALRQVSEHCLTVTVIIDVAIVTTVNYC
jgi:hypothetical protein